MDTTPVDTTNISHDVQAEVDVNPMPSTLKSLANTNQEQHTLKDMLERFILIETFKWRSDSPVLPLNVTPNGYLNAQKNFIKQFLLPQSLFDSSSLLRQKLNNFMLMKADIEFDVKVNANPFQQGALLAAYFPRSLSTSRFRAEASEYLASVTSAPNRKLILEQGNSLRFRIPYAHILDWIDLTKSDDSFGVMNLYVISPLSGETSAEEVDVTVRMRFVDIELEAPTNVSLLSQEQYRQKELEHHTRLRPAPRLRGYIAHSSEGEKQGPVTKISSAVASIGDTLSGVPLIGRAAGMVGWFARSVAAVATVLGWSKPTMLTMPSPTVAKPAAYMGNVEGQDSSCVLAALHDNAIDNSSMIPSDIDEMCLKTIFDKPNIIGRYTIPKSAFTQNKLLFSFEVSPFNSLSQQLESNGQDFCFGSFSFTSLLFKLWRGSINFALDLIKTQYHSARVMAVYFPNTIRIDIPEDLGELMTTNPHMIFDLTAKSGEEFSIEQPILVPYTSDEPWKKTLWKDVNFLYDATTMETSTGTIGIYCLNELVCPPTVAQEVTFLLSVCGGEDYEVALPQIQLQAGFATNPVPPPDIATPLAEIMTELYSDSLYVGISALGTTPDIAADFALTDTVISQFIQPTEWLRGREYPVEAPDGVYDATLDLAFTSNIPLFLDGPYAFKATVLDGKISHIDSDQLILQTLLSGTESVLVQFQVPAEEHHYVAEMSPGTSDPMNKTVTIAETTVHNDISLSTTGEYCKSLRPLIKRFVKTRQIDATTPVSLTPADFNNYDSQNPTLPIGNRAWADKDATSGGLLPESWLSLVSYIFRLCSGSVRSKVFIPFNVQATTSLDITDTLATEFNTSEHDPAFVTQGIISNAVETTIPYYGQYRARTVGDDLKGIGAKQRLALSGTGLFDYYEAAGDDFSFWFMVGPPIMRPIDVIPTPIPVITPAVLRRQR